MRQGTSGIENDVKRFHSVSDRHVLILEARIPNEDKYVFFHKAELVRLAGNELTGTMKKRYEQLMRTKRYRKLKELYGTYSSAEDGKNTRHIAEQMNQLQKQYGVTWNDCRKAMIPIGKKYNVDAIFALTKAEDVWRGVEKCLYSDGRILHFYKRGELPSLRAKQINRGNILSVKNGKLCIKHGSLCFSLEGKDRYETDEINAVVSYMQDPEKADRKAVEYFRETGRISSTCRPCYVTLVPKMIRGKLRLYVHITVEGKSIPKYRKDGKPRHTYGKGNIGADIGTQTVAYTSDHEAGLKNLAERGPSILENERNERLLYRAMDRSRRANNPQNYNEDGTVKKGKKRWKNSKRYLHLKYKHQELSRKNAINRHLSINEDVNHIRSLGNVLITERKNAKKLQKKARPSENKEGKPKRRKRFGKSIKNRCPGYFQQRLKEVFICTGGTYIEVPNTYRASQYDHTRDDYVKKKLSDRMYQLSDGTLVQRDWYSSYVLYQYDLLTKDINKDKCREEFNKHYSDETALIERIKDRHIKVLNSGIKFN